MRTYSLPDPLLDNTGCSCHLECNAWMNCCKILAAHLNQIILVSKITCIFDTNYNGCIFTMWQHRPELHMYFGEIGDIVDNVC